MESGGVSALPQRIARNGTGERAVAVAQRVRTASSAALSVTPSLSVLRLENESRTEKVMRLSMMNDMITIKEYQ